MKNFKIAEPQSIEQVTSLPTEEKEIFRLLAGGTDLIAEIKDGIIEPEFVVDLKTIPGLAEIRKEKDGLRVGAMTTISELADDELVKTAYPALHQAALSLATPQLRNVGTVGGNLCQRPRCWYYRDPLVKCRKKGGSRCYAIRGRNKYHAIFGGDLCSIVHPSDLAPALIALDARVSISSPEGEKSIPLEEFFVLPRVNIRQENILKPNEVLREVKIPPARKGEKSVYLKLRERGTWDFAIVSAAVRGSVSAAVFKEVKIVLGGVAPVPWRLEKAEQMIKGKKATEALLREAAREALKDARPMTENGYKKDLVETIVYRAAISLV